MFRKADMALTNVVPLTGRAVTIGSPRVKGSYPKGLSCTPWRRAARTTEMKVKMAEAVPSLAIMSKVRGREPMQQMMVTMIENVTVRQ